MKTFLEFITEMQAYGWIHPSGKFLPNPPATNRDENGRGSGQMYHINAIRKHLKNPHATIKDGLRAGYARVHADHSTVPDWARHNPVDRKNNRGDLFVHFDSRHAPKPVLDRISKMKKTVNPKHHDYFMDDKDG